METPFVWTTPQPAPWNAGSCSSHLPLLQWRDIMVVFPMAEAEWIHLINTPGMADSKSKETGC